jgi:uncharacterized protein (TIGR02996 family)
VTEHESFLRIVCEYPDEDAPRLIFADWLEDQGELASAEFIRAQILRGEVTQVVSHIRPEIAIPHFLYSIDVDQQNVSSVTYKRGFVCSISLTSRCFLEAAPSLFTKHPITEVFLTDKRPNPIGPRDNCRYSWFRRFPAQFESCYDLPDGLKVLLSGANPSVLFETEAQAHEWFSKLCVEQGRKLADLPSYYRHDS